MSRPSNELIIKDENAHQIAQALYNAVTGKTESISKRYFDNYEVNNSSIVQLYRKLTQTYVQWQVIEKNENITVFHVDDNKQVFSSIERFQLYDKSTTSPVQNINLTFNILLALPNIEKPQPYKITVDITSKVALRHHAKLKGRSQNLILKLFRGDIISVKVEYVDYTVARTMLSTIDSWISEIELNKKNKFIDLLQRKSHWFSPLSSAIMFLISAYVCYYLVDIINLEYEQNIILLKYLISTIGITGLFFFIGGILGRFLEISIDRIDDISYISLNKGDNKILSEAQKKQNRSYLKAMVWFILLTLQAVFSSTIANWIMSKI